MQLDGRFVFRLGQIVRNRVFRIPRLNPGGHRSSCSASFCWPVPCSGGWVVRAGSRRPVRKSRPMQPLDPSSSRSIRRFLSSRPHQRHLAESLTPPLVAGSAPLRSCSRVLGGRSPHSSSLGLPARYAKPDRSAQTPFCSGSRWRGRPDAIQAESRTGDIARLRNVRPAWQRGNEAGTASRAASTLLQPQVRTLTVTTRPYRGRCKPSTQHASGRIAI